MSRRRAPAPRPSADKDTYHVLDPKGVQIGTKTEAAHALVFAHRAAEQYPTEVVLTVERRTLFGPAVALYRVTRDEGGTVFTNANRED
jgi:hypothetical protein